MEARTHVAFGCLAGLACSAAVGLTGPGAVGVTVLAGLVSTLPDIDQAAWWRSLDRWLPDEWLGNGGPLQHRGLTHWFVLPLAAGFVLWPTTSGLSRLALIAVVVGLLSHMLGDFIVGKGGYGRGPGIPLLPWWGHVGAGLDCGGLAERVLIRPLILAAIPVAAYLVLGGTL